MKILIACEDLRIGGAQKFALSLAKGLQEALRYNIFIYSQYSDYIDYSLVKRIYPEAKIISPNIPGDFLIRKLDSLIRKMKIDFSLRNIIVIQNIQKTIRRFSIHQVHSNMFKSDYLFARALKNSSSAFIITMHGNYEEFFYNQQKGEGEIILNYNQKVIRVLERVGGLAYLTEKNLKIFNSIEFHEYFKTLDIEIRKIYNGFKFPRTSNLFDGRRQLNIPQDHTVFGMVSRGIPEKGWETAINAFQVVNSQKRASLILVGSSGYLDELNEKYSNDKSIYFIGYSNDPLFWTSSFDVGLLPTTFKSESLPTIIIEYLFCGKPVISTDIGEISQMITTDGKKAGFVLPLDTEEKVNSDEIAEYMRAYLENHQLLEEHSSLARKAFSKFEMDRCVHKYSTLYSRVLKGFVQA
jgi:glycosyltransferase involved in cell wall biosynthesis